MTTNFQLTIQGDNLDKIGDGDWTLTALVDDKYAAQCGLSGTLTDALELAKHMCSENHFIEG
ncbi:MAG: hypothetical protein ACKVIH_01425 [Burkholderiales bacterium]